MVLAGRLRTRLRVSRIRSRVTSSLLVRFQSDRMSSCRRATLAVEEKQDRPATELGLQKWHARPNNLCLIRPFQRNKLDKVLEETHLISNRNDGTTDFVPHHELLAQNGKNQVLPTPGRESLLQPDDPLSAPFVRLVLQQIHVWQQWKPRTRLRCQSKIQIKIKRTPPTLVGSHLWTNGNRCVQKGHQVEPCDCRNARIVPPARNTPQDWIDNQKKPKRKSDTSKCWEIDVRTYGSESSHFLEVLVVVLRGRLFSRRSPRIPHCVHVLQGVLAWSSHSNLQLCRITTYFGHRLCSWYQRELKR